MASVVRVESTPNPNSRKFVVDTNLTASTRWFGSAADAGSDPLASALFTLDGVANVMMLNDFVSVGKTGDASWDTLEPAIKDAIERHS